jgi:hypothetical protein
MVVKEVFLEVNMIVYLYKLVPNRHPTHGRKKEKSPENFPTPMFPS